MESIKTDVMANADVMLYHGNTWLAKAIRFFDSSDVNHAALYLGNKMVAEAQSQGLVENTIQKSISDAEYVVIRRLTTLPETIQPVLDVARVYLADGNRYGYEQIVLLAFLGLTRKLPLNIYFKWLLRKVLDEAADLLMSHGDRQPMICSEFVYRCYNEALPSAGDPYALDINPFPVSLRMAAFRGIKAHPVGRMHPDSLLSWATGVIATGKKPVSKAMLVSLGQLEGNKLRKSAPLSNEERKISAMPLEALLKNYLQETKKPATKAYDMEASLRTAEMLAGIKKFAEAYHTRAIPSAKAVSWSAKAVKGEVPQALNTVLAAVADFVTPGDLKNCKNLYDIGKLRP